MAKRLEKAGETENSNNPKITDLTNKEHTFAPLQQSFISMYNGNIKSTALACGMNYGYARQLMQRPDIREAVKLRHNKEYNPKIATRQELQAHWTKIMYDELVEVKDRLKASELLAKSRGEFIDNINVGSKGMTLLDAAIKGEALQIAAIRLDAIILSKGKEVVALPVKQSED